MVAPSKVSKLEENYEEKIREAEGLSQRLKCVEEREMDLQEQMSILLGEKKNLHEKSMLLEARVNHLERDISLKEA